MAAFWATKQDLSGFGNSSSVAWQIPGSTTPLDTTKKKDNSIEWFIDPNQINFVKALWADRANQIVNNLNTWFRTDPTKFQSLDTFKTAYGYNQADPGKKAILDAFIKAKTPELLTPASGVAIWPNRQPTQAGWVIQPVQTQNTLLQWPEAAAISNPEITNQQVDLQNVAAPSSTWNKAFDATLNKQAATSNQYLDQFGNVINAQNTNLTNLQKNSVTDTQEQQKALTQSAQRGYSIVQQQEEAAKLAEEASYKDKLAANTAKMTAQKQQNDREIARARLMASLSGSMGWSLQTVLIQDAEQRATDLISSIDKERLNTTDAHNAELKKLSLDMTEKLFKIDDAYNTAISASKKQLRDEIFNIESTKWKNSKEWVQAAFDVATKFWDTVMNITKQAQDLKLAEIKIAEDKRQSLSNEMLNAAKTTWFVQEAITDANWVITWYKNKLDASGRPILTTDASQNQQKLNIEQAKLTQTTGSWLDEVSLDNEKYKAWIPTALRWSDKEDAKWTKLANIAMKKWQTVEEFRNEILNIKTNPLNKDAVNTVMSIFDQVPGSAKALWPNIKTQVANNLNAWKYSNAILVAESAVFNDEWIRANFNKQDPNQYMSAYLAPKMWAVFNALKVIENMWDAEKAKLSVQWSFVNDIINKLGWDWQDAALTELRRAIQWLNAEERNAIFGASVTNNESGASADIFTNTAVWFDTIKARIEWAYNQRLNDYNAVRDGLSLTMIPEVPPSALSVTIKNMDKVYWIWEKKPDSTMFNM